MSREFRIINYMSDIPEGWRLASCREFEQNHSKVQDMMEDWSICQVKDGKTDGPGYGGKAHRQTRAEREKSCTKNERMGEMLITKVLRDEEDGLRRFAAECQGLYRSFLSREAMDVINDMLSYSGPGDSIRILVSSCPGDAHGGVHSRVQALCKGEGWGFAPVQFTNRQDADDWQRLWKVQVESFACNAISGGRSSMFEVKIDGGGQGCKEERSRNMEQWWVDWVKRLGDDICEDLRGCGATGSLCPSGSLQILIGQAVVSEDDFTEFARNRGHELSPIETTGFDFALHALVLEPNENFWALMTDKFVKSGSSWRSISSNSSSGCF